MTYIEAVELVIQTVSEIQELSGRDLVKVNEKTVPIGGVPGFDSLNGVELAAMVDDFAEIGDVGNLCASQDGTRALTVKEIADRIVELTSE